MASNFNINDLLGGSTPRANENTPSGEPERRQMLKVIPIHVENLIPSAENFYTVEDVSELKNSIEMFGVIQPLAVKPLEGGKYRIIAGHRRHRACTELVAEGKTDYEYVPCGIQAERDEIKERIMLIMTNSTTRELSDWEKMKQAEELNKYFSILKKRDNLPGRVRDLVAETLNTSSTQIARMDAISKNLTPELTQEFKEGRLGLSAAYELSGMDQDRQREAFTEYEEKGGLSINDVRALKQEAETPPEETTAATTPTEPPAQPVPSPAPPEREYEPRPEREYPETSPDFEEGEADEYTEPEITDFAEMSAEEKAEAAVDFLNGKRFNLFAPGEDTRILDFIIETLESYGGNGGV